MTFDCSIALTLKDESLVGYGDGWGGGVVVMSVRQTCIML